MFCFPNVCNSPAVFAWAHSKISTFSLSCLPCFVDEQQLLTNVCQSIHFAGANHASSKKCFDIYSLVQLDRMGKIFPSQFEVFITSQCVQDFGIFRIQMMIVGRWQNNFFETKSSIFVPAKRSVFKANSVYICCSMYKSPSSCQASTSAMKIFK